MKMMRMSPDISADASRNEDNLKYPSEIESALTIKGRNRNPSVLH